MMAMIYKSRSSQEVEIVVLHSQKTNPDPTRNVSDSEELLRTMSCFEETKFLHYLNAEAPVLRKNAKRSKRR